MIQFGISVTKRAATSVSDTPIWTAVISASVSSEPSLLVSLTRSPNSIGTAQRKITSREVIFRCAVPMEFGDRVRLTNRDGSLDTEAEITAVQIGVSETLVAARFVTEIPNWIIKA